MDPTLKAKLESWYSWTRTALPEAHESVKKAEEGKDVEALHRWFEDRLVFGTAGIRGRMGPGYDAHKGFLNDNACVFLFYIGSLR